MYGIKHQLSKPGFPKLAVHGYPLAIYQFARVPPKFSHNILQKNPSIKSKPCLKAEKKTLQFEWVLYPNSIENQKKGLLPDFNRILSPNSIEDLKQSSPQFGVKASPQQFKHLSSGYNVSLEKSKCNP